MAAANTHRYTRWHSGRKAYGASHDELLASITTKDSIACWWAVGRIIRCNSMMENGLGKKELLERVLQDYDEQLGPCTTFGKALSRAKEQLRDQRGRERKRQRTSKMANLPVIGSPTGRRAQKNNEVVAPFAMGYNGSGSGPAPYRSGNRSRE